MRYVSLFSGIEAASAAWAPLGWEPVAFAETDPFCSAWLAERHPGVPNLGDVAEVDWRAWRGKADVVVGGSPCQAFSQAGLRGGLDDPRGPLMYEWVRAVHEIEPEFAVFENVPGMLNDRGNAFGHFLAALVGHPAALEPSPFDPAGRHWRKRPDEEEALQRWWGNAHWSEPQIPWWSCRWDGAGVVAGPRAVCCWRVLDAQHFGVAQQRRRVFLVAGRAGDWRPATVLLEPEVLPGDHAQGAAARSRAPRHADPRAGKAGFWAALVQAFGAGREDGGHRGVPDIARTVTAKYADNGGKGPAEPTNVVCALKSSIGGADDNEAQGGRLVVVEGDSAASTPGLPRLRAGCGRGSESSVAYPAVMGGGDSRGPRAVAPSLNGGHRMQFETEGLVAFEVRGREGGAQAEAHDLPNLRASKGIVRTHVAFTIHGTGQETRDAAQETETAGALPAGGDGGPRGNSASTVVAQCQGGNVGPMGTLRGSTGLTSGVPFVASAVANTITSKYGERGAQDLSKPGLLVPDVVVRRLTPTECERLQGFPDGATLLDGYRKRPPEASRYLTALREWRARPAPGNRRKLLRRAAVLMELADYYGIPAHELIGRGVTPDGPRYRALGNSMAVPVVRWIGERIGACR